MTLPHVTKIRLEEYALKKLASWHLLSLSPTPSLFLVHFFEL